jgi:hypothetical protein
MVSVLRNYLVERLEFVVHEPGLEPVAFVGNVELAQIARRISDGHDRVSELAEWLQLQSCEASPMAMIEFLIKSRILEAA